MQLSNKAFIKSNELLCQLNYLFIKLVRFNKLLMHRTCQMIQIVIVRSATYTTVRKIGIGDKHLLFLLIRLNCLNKVLLVFFRLGFRYCLGCKKRGEIQAVFINLNV